MHKTSARYANALLRSDKKKCNGLCKDFQKRSITFKKA